MANYDMEKAKEHFAAKMAFTTGPHELNGANKSEITIVDVRFPSDYREARIPGAVNLPKGKWSKPAGLSRDKLNVLYCYSQTCHLAAEAALELANQGYRVVEMEGGFEAWQKSNFAIESGEVAAAA
ncbi:MAG: rhodanese-like domain-containing protein [Burkholderiales bacterium]